MSIGVLITGLVGYYVSMMFTIPASLLIGLFICQLALIFIINKSPKEIYFFIFAIFEGVFFGSILAHFNQGDLILAFVSASALFAVLAIIGATTKKDLTSWGTVLIATLITLLIVIVINIFIQSSLMTLLIAGAGVILFSLLTIYNTNQIKKRGDNQHNVVTGALLLFLDFINLFLFILQLITGFGKK